MSDPPVGDGNLRPDAEQAFAHHLRELAVQHARRAHWRKNSLETPNDVAVYLVSVVRRHQPELSGDPRRTFVSWIKAEHLPDKASTISRYQTLIRALGGDVEKAETLRKKAVAERRQRMAFQDSSEPGKYEVTADDGESPHSAGGRQVCPGAGPGPTGQQAPPPPPSRRRGGPDLRLDRGGCDCGDHRVCAIDGWA